MKPSGKTIIVTGAGSGMGRALTLQLLNAGAHVAAVDLHSDSLKETARLAGPVNDRLSLHVVDISDRANVELLPQEVIKHHGQLDGLINNAGIIQPFVKTEQLEWANIERVMRVNFYGPLNLIKAALPLLKARDEAHIVNISSMGGFLPVPGQAIYGASKAALKLMTEALWAELKDTSVRVTVIFTGAVSTNITTNSGLAMPEASTDQSSYKMLDANKAAKLIIEAMVKNKFRATVGSDASLMDKLYRLHPRFATGFIAKQMKALLG